MAKYICPESMDGGPAYIQANCNLLAVVMAFTVGQSYDAVMGAGNVLATADMAPGDFSFANGGVANERVMNNASKGATASGTGTPTHSNRYWPNSGIETSEAPGVIRIDRRCSWVTSLIGGQNRLKRLIW